MLDHVIIQDIRSFFKSSGGSSGGDGELQI
jgi:hypothetical protein